SKTTCNSPLAAAMWYLNQFWISTTACCLRVTGDTPFIAPGPAIRPMASARVNFRSLRISRSISASASERCLSLLSLMCHAPPVVEAVPIVVQDGLPDGKTLSSPCRRGNATVGEEVLEGQTEHILVMGGHGFQFGFLGRLEGLAAVPGVLD